MKLTKDNVQIPSRIWYYLLDFNDRNDWQIMESIADTNKLSELTAQQLRDLFITATQIDTNTIAIP